MMTSLSRSTSRSAPSSWTCIRSPVCRDRKSTRLNSSHSQISYAVFCLKKKIAAGFNRLGPLRKNAGNQEVASSRNEVLTEMTNVVGSALLGVTLGCARCHDHKFDPIRQSDYYRIQAYFAAAQPQDIPRVSAEEQAAWKAKMDALEGEVRKLKRGMRTLSPGEVQARTKRIEEIQDNMPAPPAGLQSMTDDMEK